MKIILRLVRTGKYIYKNTRVYEYKVREKNVIGQKGNNIGQGRIERR